MLDTHKPVFSTYKSVRLTEESFARRVDRRHMTDLCVCLTPIHVCLTLIVSCLTLNRVCPALIQRPLRSEEGCEGHVDRRHTPATKGPMWGYPVFVLGAVCSFLEPFCGHLSPNIDKVSEELTLRYPHVEPWVAHESRARMSHRQGHLAHKKLPAPNPQGLP